MSIEFLVTSLIVVVSPGTGALITIAAGLSRGTRASVIAAIGCTLGVVPHMVAAITGLAALLHTSAVAFQAVKVAGVVYLLWMAWQTLRERGPLRVDVHGVAGNPDATAAPGAWQVIWSAVLANVLNPKLSIFFVAFLPQFVPTGADGATLRMAGLSAVFALMTLVVFISYGVFAAAMRDRVLGAPRVMAWLRRSFAAAFVVLGARLASTSR